MREQRASAHLRGTLHLIERQQQKPSADLLRQIRQTVVDAIEILREPDPVKQRIGLIVLLIKESTSVKTIRQVERITITDQLIYSRAIRMIHDLPHEVGGK